MLAFLQKGLQYVEAELKVVDPSGSSLNGEPLSLLSTQVSNLIAKGVELKDIKRAEREREKDKKERARSSRSESSSKKDDAKRKQRGLKERKKVCVVVVFLRKRVILYPCKAC